MKFDGPAMVTYRRFSEEYFDNEIVQTFGLEKSVLVINFIRRALDEMISICNHEESLYQIYSDRIYVYINFYNTHCSFFDENIVRGQSANRAAAARIFLEVTKSLEKAVFGAVFDDVNSDSRQMISFLSIYNSLKNILLSKFFKVEEDIFYAKERIGDLLEEAAETNRLIKENANKAAVSNYAVIFEDAANRNSRFETGKWYIKFGAAERWIILSIVLLGLFGLLVFKLNVVLPVKATVPTLMIIEYITRMLVVSFAIYLITFTLKQFNIQRHQATLNLHRKNVLNSFELFLKGIDTGDTTTKETIVREVAKAIYESGPSGYVAGNDSDAPSFDFSQYINPGK